MALPVIGDCFRITVNFRTVDGITPRNVFHVGAPSGTELEIGDRIVAAAPNFLYAPMLEDFDPTTLTVLALDGTSAGVDADATPVNWCEDSGSEILPSLAMVLSLKTGLRGPAHRGRQFIGPLCENNTANGMVSDGTVSAVEDNWNAFILALSMDDITLQVASYAHATTAPVTSIVGRRLCGTQRRRLEQLR